MRLYVETMDATVVEFDAEGRVKFEPPSPEAPADQGEWVKPSVQERRAIIHAAQSELENLKELLDTLERLSP